MTSKEEEQKSKIKCNTCQNWPRIGAHWRLKIGKCNGLTRLPDAWRICPNYKEKIDE